ncbi:response regulator (plasmid) [Rhodobacteraceae bacterium SC52]|nr:response regulator [Rhodobacteraceae bacterium SC52]
MKPNEMRHGWRGQVITIGVAIVVLGVISALAVAPILLKNNLDTVNASALRSELFSLHLALDDARAAASDRLEGTPAADTPLRERSQLLLHRVRVVLAYPGATENLPSRAEDLIRLERFLESRLDAIEGSSEQVDLGFTNLARTVQTEGANLDRYVLDAMHRLGRVASMERTRIEELSVLGQRFALFLLVLGMITLATLWFQRRELSRTWDTLQTAVTELAEAHRIAHIGTVRWDFEKDLVTWSDEFARIYGLEPDGQMDGERFQQLLVPEDVPKVVASEKEALARSAVSGKPEPRFVRYRAYRSDGAILELESQSELLANAAGEPLLMVSTVRDVTAEETAKRASSESERRLAAAQRITNLGSFRRNIKTGQRVWSKELYQMLGLDPTSKPMSLEEIVHPDEVDRITSMMAELIQPGEPLSRRRQEFDTKFVVTDGGLLVVRGTVEVSFDENGAPDSLTGALRDITNDVKREQALRAALEEAERANEAKSQFLAIASHELRTPMNGVMGMLAALENTKLTKSQQTNVDVAMSSANSLMTILNDILDMSKIEAGRLDIQPEPFELAVLVESVVKLHSQNAHAKGLSLTYDIDNNVPEWVNSDEGRLRQILVNLVGNAVKFTLKGGVRLSVAAVSAQQGEKIRLRFSVSDTGIGIPMEKHDQVFESFNQLDASYTRRFGGTGLGLSISQSLAKLLGGTLSFESKVNVGSTFSLELPVKLAEHADVEQATEAEAYLAPMRILVADDNSINLVVAESMLEILGQSGDFVENGQEAVSAAETKHYDVILMDISMPVLDGLEATRRIRALGGDYADIPILALTAHAGPDEKAKCVQAGFNDILTKPVSCAVLRDTLVRWQTLKATSDATLPPSEPETGSIDPNHGGDTFDEIQSLQAAIEELAANLGEEAVPDMLGAGASDLDRHIAVIEAFCTGTAEDDAALEGSFHSIVGIARLFGCPVLAEKARALETADKPPKPNDPDIADVLQQVSGLCVQLKSRFQKTEMNEPHLSSGVDT